jgi:RNA polymerase sigma-B factor
MSTGVAAAPDIAEVHREFQETRSPELRGWLVQQYERLAFDLAGRLTHHAQDREDLNQVALLALVKAVDRYDVDRGTAFTTFAWATITGELKRYRRDRGWAIHVPRRLQEVYLHVSGAIEQCTHELGRSPTVSELAAAIGEDEDAVIEAFAVRDAFRPASLDAPVRPRPDGALEALELADVDRGFADMDDEDTVGRLISMLPPREQQIVKLRFYDELSQSQIAALVGLSQMQVSRVLSRSLERLRRWSRQAADAEVV